MPAPHRSRLSPPLRVLLLLLVCGGLVSAAAASDEPLAIGQVVFRDWVVTIHPGAEALGPRYSVYTRAGALRGRELTDSELQAHHPQLHERLRSALAGGAFPWAGLDVEPPR